MRLLLPAKSREFNSRCRAAAKTGIREVCVKFGSVHEAARKTGDTAGQTKTAGGELSRQSTAPRRDMETFLKERCGLPRRGPILYR
jgi:hypothetical protein